MKGGAVIPQDRGEGKKDLYPKPFTSETNLENTGHGGKLSSEKEKGEG